jgi:hypothetical protein
VSLAVPHATPRTWGRSGGLFVGGTLLTTSAEVPMTKAEARAISAWAAGFAARATGDRLIAFADVVDDGILRQVPELADDPMLVADLHSSTRAHWAEFLSLLSQPEHRLVLAAQAVDLARTLARRGMDLAVLLKIYRAAHHGVFETFSSVVDGLDDTAPPREEVLKFLWRRADLWIDDSIEELIKVFYAERERLHDGALARRATMIDALLDGSVTDVAKGSEVLGHPLRQWQTGFVIWSDEADLVTSDFLQATATDLGAALRGSRPLTHVAGSRDLWVWVATPEPPPEDVVSVLQPTLAGRGVHVAVGLPAQGIDGFRSSHTEARAAERLCLAARRCPSVVTYREVEMLSLAMENESLLKRMVEREVGQLSGADRNLALVRETVLAYLTNRMNVETTADKLFVHKNTVRYRLARAEELLGHPLTTRPAQVELGLRYLDWFGRPQDAGPDQ